MPSLPGPSQPHAFGDAIYRKFFGGYADEMYLHDAQGTVLDVNQSACDNTGYAREELIGMCVTQLSAQYDHERLQQLWADHPVGENLVAANCHRRKDGSIYHLDVHLTCQMHDGRKYFLAVGHCTDEQRSREREIEHLNQRLQTLVDERTRQLKESTRLLEAVMQQIPDAVFIKDLQGRYMYGNPSLEVQLGQPLERILGSTDAELLEPEAAASYADSDRVTLQRQEAGLFELLSGVAGASRIFNVMKAPYRDDSGTIVGLLGIARDITDVRHAEIEMAHNYEMLRQAERVAKIGSWTLDLASNTFTASEMLTEMNGLQPHDPPLTPETLAAMIPPQEHALLGAAIGECIQHGTPYTIDVHHKRPGGGTFPGRIRGQAYRNAQGAISMLHGTLQDLTEHVEAEERLQTLADNLPNGAIFRCEQTGNDRLVLRYVSAGIHALLGLTAQGLMAHQNMFVQLVHEDDRKEFFRAMYSAMQAQMPFVHVCRMLHADGHTRWTRTRAISRRTHHAVYWEGILLDITAEHEAQRALHSAKEAAEAGERAKSEFLATMSHEIRTPMNTVIGMTQLLQQTPMSPKQRNYLNKVSLSANALLKIINEILDFSKLEAEMLHIDNEPFALEELLESVVTVTGLQAEQKGVEIVYNIAASVPRHLIGDVQRLSQVLTNLVGNAIKFTDRGEVVISMHAQPVPHTDHELELHVTVRDTGIGIHPEHMQQLFQPFTQAEAHISRRFGGTGLGLAICHKLVQLMDGAIAVHSQLGQGSTFSFHVRLQAQAMAPLRKHFSDPQCRVLVVDDNLMAREMLSGMVRNFGLECEVASSGAQALALLQQAQQSQQAFQLVLMDWKMPGMDGLETAERIREDAHLGHTPAMLMVTAYCRDEVLERVSALQMQGLIIKPVTESVLFNAMQEALQLQPGSLQSHHSVESPTRPQRPMLHIPASLQGRRVLVVDDNQLNREVAQDFLELAAVQVTTASSGREALALLSKERFDAVLLDVQMPEMDGLEVARRIRQDPRWQDLPIWALTAQAQEEDRRAIVASGM
ncbi:MAG: response regulator, partial [Comamonas sp.]|nr:response regulator [Candidatus Comamonas equi]